MVAVCFLALFAGFVKHVVSITTTLDYTQPIPSDTCGGCQIAVQYDYSTGSSDKPALYIAVLRYVVKDVQEQGGKCVTGSAVPFNMGARESLTISTKVNDAQVSGVAEEKISQLLGTSLCVTTPYTTIPKSTAARTSAVPFSAWPSGTGQPTAPILSAVSSLSTDNLSLSTSIRPLAQASWSVAPLSAVQVSSSTSTSSLIESPSTTSNTLIVSNPLSTSNSLNPSSTSSNSSVPVTPASSTSPTSTPKPKSISTSTVLRPSSSSPTAVTPQPALTPDDPPPKNNDTKIQIIAGVVTSVLGILALALAFLLWRRYRHSRRNSSATDDSFFRPNWKAMRNVNYRSKPELETPPLAPGSMAKPSASVSTAPAMSTLKEPKDAIELAGETGSVGSGWRETYYEERKKIPQELKGAEPPRYEMNALASRNCSISPLTP